MPRQSFKSFEEWGQREQARRFGPATGQTPDPATGAVGARLRVRAELAASAGPPDIHECRAIVVDWVQETLGSKLPRKACRHRPFAHSRDNAACRAVRLRDGRRDHWAIQVERTPGHDQEVVTEIVVARPHKSAPSVSVTVHDRSVIPVETVKEYPADMLAAMAGRIPLLQGGRRLTHRPIVVESDATMNAFLKMLVDSGRDMPFAVVSIPPDDEGRGVREEQWDALARSLTGLAVTWVLPPAMTYRLSDTVSKPLSVFLGAWRFYRPGFHPRADRSDHPLILRNRMADERAVNDTARQFVRMAAEERMRADPGEDESLDYTNIAREAASTTRGPARLVSYLRNSLLGGAAPVPPQRYSASSADSNSVASVPQASDQSLALVRELPPPATPQIAGRSAPNGRSASPVTAPRKAPLLRSELRAAKETARVRASRYEQERERGRTGRTRAGRRAEARRTAGGARAVHGRQSRRALVTAYDGPAPPATRFFSSSSASSSTPSVIHDGAGSPFR